MQPNIHKLTDNHEPGIPVIGYVRVSTWREEKISPELQMAAITEATARSGRYVAEWIPDLDVSGRHFKRRVMQAIEAVEGGRAAEVWVWKFSRFGRSRHGVAINLARVEAAGGQLLSATEDVDATTATGRFARGMLFEVAAFESDRTGEMWRETHAFRRASGVPATGGKRFGYRWWPRAIPDGQGGWATQEERYEVQPEPAEAVLTAYQEYNAGTIGFGRIAAMWHDLGFVNTRGARWQDQTVRWYLDSGFAAGLLRVHRQDVRCGNPGRCQARDHYAFVPAEHEAITTGDEWDAYQERRETRRQTPRRALAPVYPLAGLIRCGLCGGAGMVHQSLGEPGYAYRCGPRARQLVDHGPVWMRRLLIEDAVLTWLEQQAAEIDRGTAGSPVTPEPVRADPAPAQQRRRAEAEVSRLAAALDRATEGHVMGDIPRETYLRLRDRLGDQRRAAERQLAELEQSAQKLPEPADYRETIAGLIAEWDTIAVASKRLLLASLLRRVEFTGRSVTPVPIWQPED